MQCKCSRTSVQLAARCATLVALVAALPAQAQQFVLVDQTYTASADNTDESHFVAELKPGIPPDFSEPVDYANGRLHVELEILKAPSSTKTLYNICLHNSSNYACLPYVEYTGEGSYDADPVFNTIWNYEEVDWTEGVNKVELILKNERELLVHADEDFYPYQAHLKLYVVAEGSRFDPSMEDTREPEAGSGGSTTMGGTGGSGAQAGEPGSGGRSGAAAGPGGSGGVDAAGSDGASAGQPGAPAGGADTGGVGGRLASTAGRAGSTNTPGTVTAGDADAGAETARSIREQLENTSGCSLTVLTPNTSHRAWLLLALGLVTLSRVKARNRSTGR